MPDTIPDTAAYLYLGLAAILAVMGLFVGSMVSRYSRYRKELDQIYRIRKG